MSLMTFTACLAGGIALVGTGWHMERAARAAHEPLDPEGPAMPLQRYRLRIYDGQYEVLPNDHFVVDVDLDSPYRNGILDRQLVALVELAQIQNEPMARPRMTVHDLKTDAKVLEWVS